MIEQSLQPRFPDVDLSDLQEAWRDILQAAPSLVQHHHISREQLSVREHMGIVLRQLQGQRFVEFEHLFDANQGPQVLVVTFIALLELAKETLIEITQAESFAPIYVRLAYNADLSPRRLRRFQAWALAPSAQPPPRPGAAARPAAPPPPH
jgi:segregation and condensation protein A